MSNQFDTALEALDHIEMNTTAASDDTSAIRLALNIGSGMDATLAETICDKGIKCPFCGRVHDATDFERDVEEYISSLDMSYSEDYVKTLVAGNIRAFAAWVRKNYDPA